jgi:hypothetical protein
MSRGLEICQQRAADLAVKCEAADEENRKVMPICAQIKDEHLALFGEKVTMLWADEGGRRIGSPDWWRRAGCLFSHTPDNRAVPATMMVFGSLAR